MGGCRPPVRTTTTFFCTTAQFIPTKLWLPHKMDGTQFMSRHSIFVVLLLFNGLFTKCCTSSVLKNELFFALWAFMCHLWLQFQALDKHYFRRDPSGHRGTILIPLRRSMAERDGSWTLHEYWCRADWRHWHLSVWGPSAARTRLPSSLFCCTCASWRSGALAQHPGSSDSTVHGHCRRAWLAAFFSRGRERNQPLRTSCSNLGHETDQGRKEISILN